MSNDKNYITKEVAAYLRCSEYTLREMVRQRKIKSFRIGRKIVFRGSDVIQWVENNAR